MHKEQHIVTVHTASMECCPGLHHTSCCVWRIGPEARSPEGWRKRPGLARLESAPLLGQESPHHKTHTACAPPKATNEKD